VKPFKVNDGTPSFSKSKLDGQLMCELKLPKNYLLVSIRGEFRGGYLFIETIL